MSDTASGAVRTQDADSRLFALVCYGLYFAAVAILPAAIVGVVLAYVKRADLRGTIWESHFANLIHVFWTSVIAFALWLALLLTGIFGIWSGVQHDSMPWLIGAFPLAWLTGPAFFVWYVYRTIKGFLRASEWQPYP